MDYQLNKGGALFYGIMLGDGCLSHHQSKDGQDYFFISITCSYRDDQEFMKEILLPLTIKLREKNVNIKQRPEKGTVELNFTDKRLFQKIKGLNFPVGKKGPELAIPKVFYEQRLLKEIVQGFFATDGSLVITKNPNKVYPRIEAHVIHRKLIEQIHQYLTDLGMQGHVYKCKINNQRWKKEQDQYRFQFNSKKNLLLFRELIGFVNPKHQRKFLEYMAAPGIEPGTPSS